MTSQFTTPQLLARTRTLDPRWLDRGLALALTIWALSDASILVDPGPSLVLLAMTVAIAWRRREPDAVLIAEVLGVLLLPSRLQLPQGVAVLAAVYSAALYSNRRILVLALLTGAGAWLLAIGGDVQIPGALVPLLLLAPAWLAGVAMRQREQSAQASAARADRLELEREAALHAERARIARELHDIVTHSVSVMVLQTGAARQILGRDEQRAEALLESVETSGRSALDELRRLLGLLSDDELGAPLTPQPGIDEIPGLVEQIKQTGLPVELCVEGESRVVSPGLAVAVYRIIQEALTNVLKHAGRASSTRVVLRWGEAAFELEVVDRGAVPPNTRPELSAGRGLAGMRERAAMYGGTFEARPGPGNGYSVRASIPLDSSRA